MEKVIYVAFGFLLGVIFAKWRFDSQMRAQRKINNKIINIQK